MLATGGQAIWEKSINSFCVKSCSISEKCSSLIMQDTGHHLSGRVEEINGSSDGKEGFMEVGVKETFPLRWSNSKVYLYSCPQELIIVFQFRFENKTDTT